MQFKKILVLAPHTDDGELGAGASLKRFREAGVEVFYAVFSACNKSLPTGYKEFTLFEELEKALKWLDIDSEHILKHNYEVREFPSVRQGILEDLVKLNRQFAPDLVLLPNSDDIHQDHQTIYQEGLRAFKHSSILGYELAWNNLHFKANFHIKVEERHIDAKWKALQEYKSQGFRKYFQADFLKGLARVRGTQANSEYAEAFEAIRLIQ